MQWLFVALGLAAGFFSGVFGIGGGIVLIPGLVFLAGFEQKAAQGTTLLMMLPPIGLFAAWEYWKQGEANGWAAVWLCLGFALGGYFGARWGLGLSSPALRRVFALLLIAVGVQMLFKK